MNSFKELDVDAELQNLRGTPPKVPKLPQVEQQLMDAKLQNLGASSPKASKAPKVEEEISRFSHFRHLLPAKDKNPQGINASDRPFHRQVTTGVHPGSTGETEADSWPCRYCGQPAVIESVEPSLDGERMLTLWHCEPCQTYSVTPEEIKEPPKGWVTATRQ